ncbi:MAG: DNA polymerase III subunit chi [Betaproteobacteria bacterium]
MNKVEFHYNVSNKFGYLQRLLHKILERELTAVVTCPADELAALDQRLWSEVPASFMPHCLASAPAATLAATPIWLASSLPAGASAQVLLNMGAPVPEDLGQVQRLLELVGTDAADAQAGRQRWRQYQGRGFEIQPYDRKGRD